MSLSTDTIYALSSGSLPAGVAILRISGPLACQALETLTRSALPAPRMAALKTIRNRNDEVIDQGLVLFFPAPHSFTEKTAWRSTCMVAAPWWMPCLRS